jgi:hypothetical protein
MSQSSSHPNLIIARLREGLIGISPVAGADLVEACNTFLHIQGHPNKVLLTIEGEEKRVFCIDWEPETITDQILRTRADLQDTLESAAVCIACLLIIELTNYTIIERSWKSTGFDYWLGYDDGGPLFAQKGRLEVSGMKKGSNPQIKQRVKQKLKQSDPTDHLNFPAYAVVVEFTRPVAHVVRK